MPGYVLDMAAIDHIMTGAGGMVHKDLEKKCKVVLAGAQDRCPVRTGALKDSLRWFITKESKGLVGYVGSDLPYAIYVEEGTSRMDPRWFLHEALTDIRGM